MLPINLYGDKYQLPLWKLSTTLQEQSYSSLYSGWSLAWDYFRSDIDDPCGVIADFCRVITDPCMVVAIPEAIGGHGR